MTMLYICWDADEGDEGDWEPVEAYFPDDAAKEFAESVDDAENIGNRRTVHVRHPQTGEVKVFDVVSEATVVYHAYERRT